jgi:hypothetical protein
VVRPRSGSSGTGGKCPAPYFFLGPPGGEGCCPECCRNTWEASRIGRTE